MKSRALGGNTRGNTILVSRYRDQIYADTLALASSRRRIEDEERQRLLSGGSPSNDVGAIAGVRETV